MKMEKRDTFNVLLFIKRTRLLKNGEAPICLRITIGGQIAEFMVKRSVPPEHWNQQKERSRSSSPTARELNHYLDSVKARLLQLHREMELDGTVITAKTLKDRYCGKDTNLKSLVEAYEEHNEKCKALIGVDYTKSTVEKFYTSLSHLKEFMMYKYNRIDLSLKEVTATFINDFEFYLKTVRSCQHNSALKHLKNLKKVIRIALANDWIKKDPFLGISFKHTQTHTEFLSSEELEVMMKKEFSIERLSQVRDIFCLCAMTGLAFIDVSQLTFDYLVTDSSGALWIRKPRQKTGTMCNIPLLAPAKAILDRYKDHPECIKKGTLLPVISNQRTNSYLKEIADLCGIKKRLTTHLARHTAATTTFLANGVSIENVAKILGHSSTKMTHHYAKVLDSSIMRDMANVEKNMAKIANI